MKSANTPTAFVRNAAIYRESEPANHLYTLVTGMVRTCKVLIDGRRQIAAFYVAGDTFGLTTGEEHVLSAEAVIDAHVLVIKRSVLAPSHLWELMRRELELAQNHLLLLARTAPERVASFLLEMSARLGSPDEVEVPMPRRDIADYLGLTIETVSRTLTQLENQSAIALPTAKWILLRDRAALGQLIA